jgi:hypothetical protein
MSMLGAHMIQQFESALGDHSFKVIKHHRFDERVVHHHQVGSIQGRSK